MHEAARSKLSATAVHTATAGTMSAEGGQAYQGFHAEMAAVIERDPFALPRDPNQPSDDEVAAFASLSARAARQSGK